MVKNERDKLISENIAQIRKDIVVIDLALKSLDTEWSEDFMESRAIIAQLRMKFVTDIRLLDSIDVSVFREEKVNSIGYRPLTLGGNKEIAKSDSDNLVSKILEDKRNVGKVMERFKPKARNE